MDVYAGLTSFKVMLDIAKTLKDMNDATARYGAVIELQEKILSAQESQTVLFNRIRELEELATEANAWKAEKTRYELHDFGGETFAYVLKADEARGEPSHKICANCFQSGRKSILQKLGGNINGQVLHRCPHCGVDIRLGNFVRTPTQQRSMRSQGWLER